MLYLSSPFRHHNPQVRQFRFEAACQAVADLSNAGVEAFSMVVHSHPIAQLGLTNGKQQSRLDIAQLERCDGLVILTLPGWEQSEGVRREFELAKFFEIPVFFFLPSSIIESYLARGPRYERVA